MKYIVACLMFVGLMVWPVVSLGQVSIWDAAFEADPAAGDPVSEGDDHIRQTKENVRYRSEVESWHGDTAPAWDNGLHRLGSARCFMDTADPTVLTNGMSDFEYGGGAGETDLDNVSSNSGGATDDTDVGHGRCYIDIDGPDDVATTDDDYTMYIYQGVAGAGGGAWVAVTANSPYEASDDQILVGNYNLIYNGSFEATNGSGEAIAPAEAFATGGPEGWAVVVGDTPFVEYTNPSTDVRYGDGYHLVLSNNGAANEGMRQTITNLNANSTYKLMARVQDDGVGATVVCRLDIVNELATADFPADSSNAAGPVWETIGGTFTTGAVLTTVDVEIYPIGVDGTECLLDHFVLYEVGDVGTDRDEISEPGAHRLRGAYTGGGIGVCGNNYNVGNCDNATTGLFVTVTPATVGMAPILLIDASISAQAGTTGCDIRLQDVTGVATLHELTIHTLNPDNSGPMNLHASVIDHVPGATSVYALEIRDSNDGVGLCGITGDYDSWIEVIMLPTR